MIAPKDPRTVQYASIPPRSEWKQCCVPIRELLSKYDLKVRRSNLFWKMPSHLVFLLFVTIMCSIILDTYTLNRVGILLQNVAGHATPMNAVGFEVVFADNDTVSYQGSIGPKFTATTVNNWYQWEIALDTQMMAAWCQSSNPSNILSSPERGLCTLPIANQIKDSNQYERCYADSNGALDDVECGKSVTYDCLNRGFISWLSEEISQVDAPSFPVQSDNTCHMVEGNGGLDRCHYETEDWGQQELSCSNFQQRAEDARPLRYSDAEDSDNLISVATRAVNSLVNFAYPGVQLFGHVSFLTDSEFAGGVSTGLDFMVTPLMPNQAAVVAIIVVVTVVSVFNALLLVYNVLYRRHSAASLWLVVDLLMVVFGFYVVALFSSSTIEQGTPCKIQNSLVNVQFRVEIVGFILVLGLIQLFQFVTLLPILEVIVVAISGAIRDLIAVVILIVLFWTAFSVAGMLAFGARSELFVTFRNTIVRLNTLAIGAEVRTTYEEMMVSQTNSFFANLYFVTFELLFFWLLGSIITSIVATTYMTAVASRRSSARQLQGGSATDSSKVDEVSKAKRRVPLRARVRACCRAMRSCSEIQEFCSSMGENLRKWCHGRSVSDSIALDRLNNWASKKSHKLKTFVTFAEIKRAVGAIPGKKLVLKVPDEEVFEIMAIVEPINVYTIEHAKEMTKQWDKEHSRDRHAPQVRSAERIAIDSGRLAVDTSLRLDTEDNTYSHEAYLKSVNESVVQMAQDQTNRAVRLRSMLHNYQDEQKALLHALSELDAIIRTDDVAME